MESTEQPTPPIFRSADDMGEGLGLSLPGLALLALYVMPGVVAAMRKHRNQNAILVLNLLLGWTLIGWVVALVWASTAQSDDSRAT